MTNPRKILHVDLDAFFCSVEELKDPTLIGTAFAVGGSPDGRGVISSCSYAARQLGVRSAMPTRRALTLCPGLKLVHGSHLEYGTWSDRVMAIFHDLTPLVEEVSIDEAFLDVSDLPQSPALIARSIQQRVADETGLPCSIGAATNKLVAKIATDAGKARHSGTTAPRAITIVPPGEEQAFLAPLPVGAIWGVGAKTAAHLNSLGFITIAHLAAASPAELQRLLGKTGLYLARAERGEDSSIIHTSHELKSVSQETTFYEDTADRKELEATFAWLSEKVARRLRQKGIGGSVVRIKVRYADFSTYTRQVRLASPTNLESILLATALELFYAFWKPGTEVRLLGVGVADLEEGWHQMSLLEPQQEKEIRLHEAVDAIRAKYGKELLQKGKIRP
jgi:DNA polymerase-4